MSLTGKDLLGGPPPTLLPDEAGPRELLAAGTAARERGPAAGAAELGSGANVGLRCAAAAEDAGVLAAGEPRGLSGGGIGTTPDGVGPRGGVARADAISAAAAAAVCAAVGETMRPPGREAARKLRGLGQGAGTTGGGFGTESASAVSEWLS